MPPGIWPQPPGQGGGGGGGQPPLGTWGGSSPWPGYATPPIAPGGQPPGGGGGQPPGTWGGDSPWPGYATPPIYLPPDAMPPEIQIPPGQALLVLYVPGQGHKAQLIPIPGPPGNLPPSETQPQPTPNV
jgi:hypothetical protein